MEQFQIATNFDFEYAAPHLGLGELDFEHFNLIEKAIDEYQLAIQFEQRPSRLSHFLPKLARALEAAGRTAEARQRYQEYLDRFPWGEHAQEALAALERLGGE